MNVDTSLRRGASRHGRASETDPASTSARGRGSPSAGEIIRGGFPVRAINSGFFAPAGLDLGAETPEEIALAIVSEIQRVFAGGSGCSLRERKMSIHGALKCADAPAPSKR